MLAAAAPNIVLLFAAAGLLIYVASRGAVDALTKITDPSPGIFAVAHFLPIAALALLAAVLGYNDVAITIPFAASVASLGLILGTLILMSPPLKEPPAHAFVWPFVIPAGLLALMAGFRGALTWWHALMMLGLGVAVMSLWQSAATDDIPFAQLSDPPTRRRLQLVMSIAVAGVGGWVALLATHVADDRTRIATGGLVATAILSPLLTLPLLGTSSMASQHGRLGSAISAIVATVLLNLCLLLPLVILAIYARNLALAVHGGAHDVESIVARVRPVTMPMAVWRVDTVLIIVAGLILMPVSLSRWTLHKSEGIAMTLAYIAYVIVSAAIAIKS